MNNFFKSKLNLLSITIVPAIVIFPISCGKKIDPDKKEEYQSKIILNNSIDVKNEVVKKVEENLFRNALFLPGLRSDLNKIIFTNSTYNNLVDEGVYIPETKEIIINTQYLKKKNILNINDQVEYLTELIVHEYNHFLINDFIKNNYASSDNEQIIYSTINNKRSPSFWNKSFYDRFKNLLNYDNDTPLYTSELIAKKFTSIGAQYNQKSLFEIANEKDMPSYPLLKINTVMAPLNPQVKVTDKYRITADSLAYLFSLDELAARKLQVIAYDYKTMIKQNNSTFSSDGWIDKDKNIWTPYLEDILNFKREMDSKDGIYLHDVPTLELKNLYREFILPQDKNITFVKFQNNKFLKENGNLIGSINSNLIHFGGVLPESSSLKIGYLDNNQFKEINFKITNRFDKHMTYTTDWIDPKLILNKEIVLKNGNNTSSLSIRDDLHGGVSTFENNAILHNFKFIIENDKTELNIL